MHSWTPSILSDLHTIFELHNGGASSCIIDSSCITASSCITIGDTILERSDVIVDEVNDVILDTVNDVIVNNDNTVIVDEFVTS